MEEPPEDLSNLKSITGLSMSKADEFGKGLGGAGESPRACEGLAATS